MEPGSRCIYWRMNGVQGDNGGQGIVMGVVGADMGLWLVIELLMVDACDPPCQEDFLPGQRR